MEAAELLELLARRAQIRALRSDKLAANLGGGLSATPPSKLALLRSKFTTRPLSENFSLTAVAEAPQGGGFRRSKKEEEAAAGGNEGGRKERSDAPMGFAYVAAPRPREESSAHFAEPVYGLRSQFTVCRAGLGST